MYPFKKLPPASRSGSRPRFDLRPVAAVCAALLAGSLSQAQAQTEKPTPAPAASNSKNVSQLDTVVVTGIRGAIESAIALKRNSDSITEALSAEDIGKLPDISIAESLSRLPGLAAQRVDGRAQVIAIRGMSPDFAGTLLNGREQTSTGTNRGVEFDQYPAELMSGAVVYKTPDGTLVGQGISGTVDLHTIRPLAEGGRTVSLNLRGERNSNGDLNHGYGGSSANGSRVSAAYIDQFADRTIGVALGFAHLDAPGQELHYKAWGFQTDANCVAHPEWGCNPVTGSTPGAATYLSGFEATTVSRADKRDGLMGVFEFKPNKNLHSTVDLYYSKFKQTEVMRGLMGSIGDGWGVPGSVFSNIKTTPVGDQTLVTSGSTTFAPNLVVRNDYNTRDDTLRALGWNTEAVLGKWTAIADLSYSSAKRIENLFETYAGTASSPTISFNLPTTPGFPTFGTTTNLADPSLVALSDPANWGHAGRLARNTQFDEMKNIRLHAKRDLEGFFSQIDVGINFNQRDKTREYAVEFATLKNGSKTQLLSAADVLPSSSLGFVGLPGGLAYDVNAVASKYYTMTPNLSGGPTGDLAKTFGVHEHITTAYAKADIESQWGNVPIHGNLGLQVIHTRQDSNANAFDSSGKVIGQIDPGTSYTDVLPSLNLVGDIGSNRKLRLGLAKTLARPRIDDMNASSSASVATTGAPVWSGEGGNPKLNPWRAWSADLSLEQYFGKSSYVAAALFYKYLDSYIYKQSIPFDFTGYINASGTAAASPIGTYNTQANGEGGNMRGLELSASLDGSLLSKSLDGFGLVATASFTSSSIKVKGLDGTASWETLPGLSSTVAGLQVFYEKNGFALRVSDRYRSDFRGEYASLFGATSLTRTLAQNTVDVQTSYEFQSGPAKGLQLLLQVVNLTDAPDRSVQDGAGFGGVTAPLEYNKYGRQYLLGFNYKFH
ncbi:TonB-dependent receptor [Paucibacter sp. KBW04]|uniref:TonB-dependent receptor n=1 Tax=Paucibacter sp. KBW04 TaxID=2153361 RepID=UPI000F568BFE|nr:TonB-dependent receptor [Paucibacter sp. KBW04]RQO61940.1 TonB-dependent receptor [Paucibacter sp. KBW04]